MSLSILDHQKGMASLVKTLVSENEVPRFGLEGFFPKKTYKTKNIAVSVKRKRKAVAVDLVRCTDANRNKFTREKHSVFMPPYFKEDFDFTQCKRYDETFGSLVGPTEVDASSMASEASDNLITLQHKIERAIEKQRSEILQTGVVTLKNGDSIDFGRQASSMKVLSGAEKWDTTTADPLKDFTDAGAFIRSEGQSASNVLNAVFGQNAFSAFMSNAKVKELADFRRISRIDVKLPQLDEATGMTYHGQFSIGDFIVNVMTYAETYEEYNKETMTWEEKSYIDSNNVVIMASDFKAETSFATIPAIFEQKDGKAKFIGPMEAEFYIRDYVDQIKMTWVFEVSSAPLAVPVDIDKIYSIKVA